MRKQHYIQSYNSNDREAYKFLNNVCHCRPDQLKNFISKNRIASYEKEKLITKEKTMTGEYYKLTDKGYKTFEKLYDRENGRYHSTGREHDAALADYYIKAFNEYGAGGFRWHNERDLVQMQRDIVAELRESRDFERSEMLFKASAPDCMVTVNEQSICYDVITDNYSQAQIEAKIEFATAIQAEIQLNRI